jgi:hypothetical protein
MPREVTANSVIAVPFVESDLDDLRRRQSLQLLCEIMKTGGCGTLGLSNEWLDFDTKQLAKRIRQMVWARYTNLSSNPDLARNLLQQEELVHLLVTNGREQFPPIDPLGIH